MANETRQLGNPMAEHLYDVLAEVRDQLRAKRVGKAIDHIDRELYAREVSRTASPLTAVDVRTSPNGRSGRPRRLSPDQVKELRIERKAGATIHDLSHRHGVSILTVSKYLK
jgi:hypothetical protein